MEIMEKVVPEWLNSFVVAQPIAGIGPVGAKNSSQTVGHVS